MSSKVSMRLLKFTALKMQCEQQDLAVNIVWMGGGAAAGLSGPVSGLGELLTVRRGQELEGGRVVREWLQEKKSEVWGCDRWSRLDSILCVRCYIRQPKCFGRCHVMKDNTALTPTTRLTPATLSEGDHWKKNIIISLLYPKVYPKSSYETSHVSNSLWSLPSSQFAAAISQSMVAHVRHMYVTFMAHVCHIYGTCVPYVWHM